MPIKWQDFNALRIIKSSVKFIYVLLRPSLDNHKSLSAIESVEAEKQMFKC